MLSKTLFSLLVVSCCELITNAQTKQIDITKPNPAKNIQVVEVSCGECNFHLKGKSCDLAVRINGKAYFVDGANIDSFGDAHAKEGFCNAVSKAEVQGEIVDNRFAITYLKLLPEKK